MSLIQQIDNDLIQASKNGEALVRDTLRLVKTTIKNAAIDKGRALSDEEVVEVFTKEVKQRQEAVTLFQAGNRPELASKEQEEITILRRYLPKQLSEAEVEATSAGKTGDQ